MKRNKQKREPSNPERIKKKKRKEIIPKPSLLPATLSLPTAWLAVWRSWAGRMAAACLIASVVAALEERENERKMKSKKKRNRRVLAAPSTDTSPFTHPSIHPSAVAETHPRALPREKLFLTTTATTSQMANLGQIAPCRVGTIYVLLGYPSISQRQPAPSVEDAARWI